MLSRDGEMVTSQDDAGNTPQHLASAGGHVGIVTKLLDAGGDVSATNKQGDTLLHSASAGGHSELVRMLIQRAPELLSKGNAKGQSPLFSAALAPDAAGPSPSLFCSGVWLTQGMVCDQGLCRTVSVCVCVCVNVCEE